MTASIAVTLPWDVSDDRDANRHGILEKQRPNLLQCRRTTATLLGTSDRRLPDLPETSRHENDVSPLSALTSRDVMASPNGLATDVPFVEGPFRLAS
jgi:hypothetical protein